MDEFIGFVIVIEVGIVFEVGFEDGWKALILVEAAYRSMVEGRIVRVEEIG